jgi:hypothetical protein
MESGSLKLAGTIVDFSNNSVKLFPSERNKRELFRQVLSDKSVGSLSPAPMNGRDGRSRLYPQRLRQFLMRRKFLAVIQRQSVPHRRGDRLESADRCLVQGCRRFVRQDFRQKEFGFSVDKRGCRGVFAGAFLGRRPSNHRRGTSLQPAGKAIFDIEGITELEIEHGFYG